MTKMILGKCRLCNKENYLIESHIIPKFVTNWIKETSATRFLRQAINPNKRIQDSTKRKLLCSDCEHIFSKYENYFAKNIFYPYLNGKIQTFQYNVNLKKFIVSTCWRVLIHSIEGFEKINAKMEKHAKNAEQCWREYLCGLKDDIGTSEIHLMFLDYVKKNNPLIPPKFQYYMMRSIDGTIYYSENVVHVFVKLPGFILFSSIYPEKLEGWNKTQVFNSGTIGTPQEILDGDFGYFLIQRAKSLNQKISKRENEKITKIILKNKDRYIKSLSAEARMEEEI